MIRVLLVDDDELSHDMLSRRLEARGYEVMVATSGEQGVAVGRKENPDVILLDLGLPDMDGLETARRLKADESTRAIPIVALTAHAMADDRRRALEAGCDDYDTKPVDLARLLGKIHALL